MTIQVVGREADAAEAVQRAFAWFQRIEECCSRFLPDSELTHLNATCGVAVPVSDIVFEQVRFAVAVAEESGGAFDPTVGLAMERRGFNREYRSGRVVETVLPLADCAVAGAVASAAANYRHIQLDPEQRTITLLHPLILDLGAVAKGFAIDMAVQELQPLENFAIDAGGDLYLAGHNPDGDPWAVGIRHPRHDDAVIETIHVSDRAVCTSGDYESTVADVAHVADFADFAHVAEVHHILDPRSDQSAQSVASATVVAANAMMADALATAAFVLGPVEGIAMLERLGVEGLLITPALERVQTRGMYFG